LIFEQGGHVEVTTTIGLDWDKVYVHIARVMIMRG